MLLTICVPLSYDARSVFSLFSMKYMGSCPLNRKNYYCTGFSCKNKTKPTSPVPNIVPDTAPVPSGLASTVFSPLL
jgi:hypothetical protein